MTRYWTCHWQFKLWQNHINAEFEPVDASGSNSFTKRGISVGDTVYIISLSGGHLYLGGRMTVRQIGTWDDIVRIFRSESFYDAEEWVFDPEKQGTPLNLHRRIAPAITKQLRFVSKDGPKEPCFISESELDRQATRGVRELTPESAALLDRIIDVTDAYPRTGQLITVTEEMMVKPVQVPTYLLTWNPELWNGEITTRLQWSCGQTRRIRSGDRLFLMRQGREPRGICASGRALSDTIVEDGSNSSTSVSKCSSIPQRNRFFSDRFWTKSIAASNTP